MPAKKQYEVFISYSRVDADNIAPIIDVVRAMKENLVFQDYFNLPFGKPWEPILLDALKQCKIVIVFWCRHAAASEYVRKEFELAIEYKKDLLPILLDETALPAELARYQGINFIRSNIHSIELQQPPQQQQQRGEHLHQKEQRYFPQEARIAAATIVETLEQLQYVD